MQPGFPSLLKDAKRASTLQLLFKCARLLNEQALATLPVPEGAPRPRAAHMSLFPHIDLEGTRPSELAKRLGISKQAVGQLVDDLVAMGVVERCADPDDGRAVRVAFTDEGRDGMLKGLEHLRRMERSLQRAVGKQPMQQLRDALLMLHDHLDPD